MHKNLISWIVRWTGHNISTDIFIGVPSYDELTGSHFPCVENVSNALDGIKQGLVFAKRKDLGAAIYADWTTSEEEIDIYLKK